MPIINNNSLKEIATGLKDLNDRIVYVGGAMVGLYATDPAASEPRTTMDIDCVVNTTSYAEHVKFEELLRQHKFQNDTTPDAPICRWVYKGDLVDVVSMDESAQSFGNKWYRPGFLKREKFELTSDLIIYRLPVTYYMATKIEALLSRGGSDWRGSKDFEDIIYILNYCPEFIYFFKSSDSEVRAYLTKQFSMIHNRKNIKEEIECALPYDEIDRTDFILDKMKQIASNENNSLIFQYVSDLHLEFFENRQFLLHHPLEVKGDVLLIAGDIAYLDLPESNRNTYSQYVFWDWASKNYKEVIVCFGNHDFYGKYDILSIHDGYCKKIRHNVHAYYNAIVHMDDTDIIVTTLWSYIEPANSLITERSVNDFYHIMYNGHLLRSEDFNTEHERCIGFVKDAISKSNAKRKIVLTHHVPSKMCEATEFSESPISGAFTVELKDYIENSNIDYWVYGHSHRNIECQIGKTKILSNQLGYVSHGEYKINGFSHSKVLL